MSHSGTSYQLGVLIGREEKDQKEPFKNLQLEIQNIELCLHPTHVVLLAAITGGGQ